MTSFSILYFVLIFHVPVPVARSPSPFLPLKCAVAPLPPKSHKTRILEEISNKRSKAAGNICSMVTNILAGTAFLRQGLTYNDEVKLR